MGRAELEALLAGVVADGADLAEELRALGVRVGVDGTGASARDAAPDNSEPGLDAMLEYMNAEQLKSVAKRYHPSANASRVVESRKAVREALANPALLDELVGKLSPLERALLGEVKRRGGVADGWTLIVHAALRGFEPPARPSSSVYKDGLAQAPAAGYLGTLLRDGLLLPASRGASWFMSSRFYGGANSPGDDFVFVDRRLFARLPEEPAPPPEPLALEPLSVIPTATHPAGPLLELFDVTRLLTEEGGVHLTRSGTVSRPLLARLLKRRPWLAGRLERLLEVALALGLLDDPGNTKDPWRVNVPRLHKLQGTPLALSYTSLVEASLHTTTDERSLRPSGISETAAKGVVLACLEVLPGHPVGLEAALAALWERALKHVFAPRTLYRRTDTEPERPAWFTGALLGVFRELGLVAVAEMPGATEPGATEPGAAKPARGDPYLLRGDEVERLRSPSEGDTAYRYAVTPGPGLAWLAQGRRLRRAEPPDPSGEPNGPSLLVQPNFDVLVYLDKLSPPAVTALGCAECGRIDARTASYKVTRGSFYRALESGLELPALLDSLHRHSLGVPDNVARSLRDWASRRERVRVRENVKLLEYAAQGERDAALGKLNGAVAVADRFILLGDAAPPTVSARHPYTLPPTRTLRFSPEGRFRLEGTTDLAGRAVLAQLATRDPGGTYHLNVAAIRGGALTTAAREALTARARGGLPPQLEALLNIWAGGAAPAVAKVSVFQHESAAALAKHPKIAPHLGQSLSETDYLVRAGLEGKLEEALAELGVTFTQDFTANVKPQAVGGGTVQRGLNTRKLRALIETAIAESRSLELRYHREKETYDGYGYAKKSKGKAVTEKITPRAVVYTGSTPYLTGETLGGGDHRHIRIGYISEIAVL